MKGYIVIDFKQKCVKYKLLIVKKGVIKSDRILPEWNHNNYGSLDSIQESKENKIRNTFILIHCNSPVSTFCIKRLIMFLKMNSNSPTFSDMIQEKHDSSEFSSRRLKVHHDRPC